MDREMIPYVVGTTKYLAANEQVMWQAILQFVTKIGSSPMTIS